jgi:hypothetical protein
VQFKAEEAAALAAAEESGEEPTTELRKSVWRYSVLGLPMGGGSLEDAEHDVKNNILNFDGGCSQWPSTCAASVSAGFPSSCWESMTRTGRLASFAGMA